MPLRERGRRTDEILDILEKLWTGEPVTHHGRYYHFDDVVIDPPLPTKAAAMGGRRLENRDRTVARSGEHGADRARAHLPPRRRLAGARRRLDRQRHRRLGADPAPPRRTRPPAGQRHLRPRQFRPYRADRRRGGGAPRAAPADRADHGDAPLVRASARPAISSARPRRIRERIAELQAARASNTWCWRRSTTTSTSSTCGRRRSSGISGEFVRRGGAEWFAAPIGS